MPFNANSLFIMLINHMDVQTNSIFYIRTLHLFYEYSCTDACMYSMLCAVPISAIVGELNGLQTWILDCIVYV